MRLLLNTIALEPNRWTAEKIPYFQLEDLLEPIAGAGFSFLEIWQYHLTTRTQEEIRTLKNRTDDLELETRIIGLYPNMHFDGDQRQHEMETVLQAAEAANQLGAHTIKIFVGMKASQALTEAEYDRSVDFARNMADHLHQYGLSLTGETHANTLFDTPVSVFQFMEDVGAPNFHICFQPYDFTSTAKTLESYQLFADQITHVHLQGRKNNEMSLLEEADIDYRQLFATLAADRFDGDLCIEFVKDCMVDEPAAFELDLVLVNAGQDLDFIGSLF